MTPSRGLCHGVFLLVQTAVIKARPTIESWVEAARRTPTIMASALDLDFAARMLVRLGLARIDCKRVKIDQRLRRVGRSATTDTLTLIARTLLAEHPPPWLGASVRDGVVLDEWVPTSDQRNLEWLGDLRDPILVDIHKSQSDADQFRNWLGQVGESVVVAIERRRNRSVRHVAQISDAFGFDVESVGAEGRKCLEVKTSLESTAGRFYISKHEVHTAAENIREWCLLQVIISTRAATADVVKFDQVRTVRFLGANEILALTPIDTSTGEWIESARISPPSDRWLDWDFEIPSSWCATGYRVSAASASKSRSRSQRVLRGV